MNKWVSSTSIQINVVFLFFIVMLTFLTVQQRNEIESINFEVKRQKEFLNFQHGYKKNSNLRPRQLQTETDETRYIKVIDAVGDGVTDDTRAIRSALRKAESGEMRAIVLLPKGKFLVTRTLRVKAGVTLAGQGYGISPTELDPDKGGGSFILYCGTGYAIKLNGHTASLRNLAVADWKVGSACVSTQSQGGVELLVKSSTVRESMNIRDVLIHQFSTGTALSIEAIESSGIAYAHFENIRITNANRGIHLKADNTSYVTSNIFRGGIIAGPMGEFALKLEGPGLCNNNIFEGMVIKPPSTSVAHVHISGVNTNVRMNNVFLEGSQMAIDKPLVVVEDSSSGNVMNGVLASTFVQADLTRNPDITFLSRSFASTEPSSRNLIWNAAFLNLDETSGDMAGWSSPAQNSGISIAYSSLDNLFPDHKILDITGANQATNFDFAPIDIPASPLNKFATFGVWAQSSIQGAIVARMKDLNGKTISSHAHTGSGEWEFISLSLEYDAPNRPQPDFRLTADAKLTAPSFTYGARLAPAGAEFLSSSGVKMAGTFTGSIVEIPAQVDSNSQMVLPTTGNFFDLGSFPDSGGTNCADSYIDILFLNVEVNALFPKGTIITLMLPSCGGCVPCAAFRNSGGIALAGGADFQPAPSGAPATLTLISSGNGFWREVARNP